MKTTRIFSFVSAALCALLLSACNTPDARIRNSPEVFARLNPDQQALVKNGQIAVGFDQDEVRLALGDPDRAYVVTNDRGPHEVWHYITYEDYQGVLIYNGYYHRYRGWGGPRFWGGPGVVYYDGYPARIHDRITVVFDTNGRVASIQQEK